VMTRSLLLSYACRLKREYSRRTYTDQEFGFRRAIPTSKVHADDALDFARMKFIDRNDSGLANAVPMLRSHFTRLAEIASPAPLDAPFAPAHASRPDRIDRPPPIAQRSHRQCFADRPPSSHMPESGFQQRRPRSNRPCGRADPAHDYGRFRDRQTPAPVSCRINRQAATAMSPRIADCRDTSRAGTRGRSFPELATPSFSQSSSPRQPRVSLSGSSPPKRRNFRDRQRIVRAQHRLQHIDRTTEAFRNMGSSHATSSRSGAAVQRRRHMEIHGAARARGR